MPYAFTSSDKVALQIRSIAEGQIDNALNRIEAGVSFEETVHSVRKSCKKLRALLRLVRPQFDDYEAENAAIRGIANGLSVARDAAVMVETFDGLLAIGGRRLVSIGGSIQPLRERLVSRERNLRSQIGEEALMSSTRDHLHALRQRVDNWTIKGKGFNALEPGFTRTYAQFCTRLTEAEHEPGAVIVHEWRKATKNYWYSMRLLRRRAPAVLNPISEVLDVLGEKLGDHHNVAVLEDWIASATLGDEQTGAVLIAIADEHQRRLIADAFVLGRQLAAEKPSRLARRMRAYWHMEL